MAFEFRYQRVLDVRNIEEQVELGEFGKIQKKVSSEQKKLDSLNDEIQKNLQKSRQIFDGRINRQYFLQQQSYLNFLEKSFLQQKNIVKKWRQKLQKQRQRLIEASQRKKVLEKLKEKKLQQFQEKLQLEEQKIVNEVGTRSFFRHQHREGS